MTADDAGLRSRLQKAQQAVMKFGKKMAFAGAGVAGIGGAILAPIVASFKGLLDRADDFNKLSVKLGVPVDQLSEFAYAAETTGQSFQDLEGHFENLAERVLKGAEGAGEAADTFKKLGVDANQLKLQNPVDQLITLAGAMQNFTNETDRLGMLSSLGGDKFQGLNALFKKGPQGILELMDEGKSVGASMSAESAAQAARVTIAFNRTWAAIKGAFFSIGESLLPLAGYVEDAVRGIVSIAKSVRIFIQENKALVQIIAAVGAALVVGGTLFIAIGTGLALAATAAGGFMAAISAIGSIVGAVLSPVGLTIIGIVGAVVALGAAIGGIVYAFVKYTDTGAQLFGMFKATFAELYSIFKTTWGGVVDAIKAGDLKLAFRIVAAGIMVVWQEMLLGLQIIWNKFKNYIVDGFMKMSAEIAKMLPESIVGSAAAIDAALAANLAARKESRDAAFDEAVMRVEQAKQKLNELAGEAAGKANAPAELRKLPSGSAMARLLGGARGTFSAPDYKQFFGASGIEQQQLRAQLNAVAELQNLNKKAGPLVIQ